MLRIFSQYVSRRTLFLLIADTFLMIACIPLAYRWRYSGDPESFRFYTEFPDFGYQVGVVVGCFLICAYYNELYDARANWNISDQFFRLSQALGFGCFVLATIYFAWPALRIGRGPFALALVLILASVTALRWAASAVWQRTAPTQGVALVGGGEVVDMIASELQSRPELNMNVVGYFSDSPEPGHPVGRVIGGGDELERMAREGLVDRVIVVYQDVSPLPLNTLLRIRTRGVVVEDAQAMIAALTGRIPLATLHSPWFIFSEGFRRSRVEMAIKRLTDLACSLVGAVLAAPIMLLTGLAVRATSPGPALYRQRRVGFNGQCFELLKFRTMKVDAEADGVPRWASENDPRLTPIGAFLRKFRFDELPQFLNVLKGDMSFVGPRPERPEFVEILREVEPLYGERHTVRPGITGWAQVCFPYGANEEEALRKLEYDFFYLKNVSLWFDFAIVVQTVKTVLWGRGR